MEKYDFANASTHLYNFVYDDFTSWYLELSKVKFTTNNDINTKKVLLKVLKSIILMIYPYTPFIAEEIYLNLLHHKESIMLDSYPEVEEKYFNDLAEEEINSMISMIKDIRAFKVNNNLAPSSKVRLYLFHNEKNFDFDIIIPYLTRFGFAEEIIIDQKEKQNLSSIYFLGQMFIEENLSNEELIKKINDKISFLDNEINRCKKMLNNPGFVNKAPKEKIELEQKKLAQFEKEKEEYLARLK